MVDFAAGDHRLQAFFLLKLTLLLSTEVGDRNLRIGEAGTGSALSGTDGGGVFLEGGITPFFFTDFLDDDLEEALDVSGVSRRAEGFGDCRGIQ